MLDAGYRKILADGDLLLQCKGRWLFGDWQNYRNLSEEARLLKGHMDAAYMQYKHLQHLYIVASTNVQNDIDFINMYQLDNSEAVWIVPHETSILEEREGVKYSNGNNKGKGGNQNQNNGNGGGNNNGNGNGGNNNQNQNQNQGKRKEQRKPMSLGELLMSTKVIQTH